MDHKIKIDTKIEEIKITGEINNIIKAIIAVDNDKIEVTEITGKTDSHKVQDIKTRFVINSEDMVNAKEVMIANIIISNYVPSG